MDNCTSILWSVKTEVIMKDHKDAFAFDFVDYGY